MGTKHIYPVWKATIDKNGKLYIKDREKMDLWMMNYTEKEMGVTIKPYRKNRSRQQEKYYHAVPKVMVAEEMGIAPEEAHDFLCKLFLTVEESKEINGKLVRYERVKSTTELDTIQYNEFCKNIRQWASLPTQDHGLDRDSGLELYIPEPNEADYENYF